ncbi:hypothetical protein HMPREF1870_00646 [Bacteroidales bacterium KA00344]|nr:hypothetical protein HMPREF1870_00646 [Bacteroidales bacterium KA00344]
MIIDVFQNEMSIFAKAVKSNERGADTRPAPRGFICECYSLCGR